MPRDYLLYLEDIVTAIGRIQNYTQDMDYRVFAVDTKTIDAVIRNLEIIGEVAKNLPDTVKVYSEDADWRKIAAFRNILAHEYFGVDSRIIWDVAQNKLEPLRRICQSILEKETQE